MRLGEVVKTGQSNCCRFYHQMGAVGEKERAALGSGIWSEHTHGRMQKDILCSRRLPVGPAVAYSHGLGRCIIHNQHNIHKIWMLMLMDTSISLRQSQKQG